MENPKSSTQFPKMQATCAEILRWACICATEEGIEVLAPVHDALLVGGPASQIEEIVKRKQACMDRASELLLGFAMRTDAKVIRYTDRFMDPRGADTWQNILKLLDQIEQEERVEFGECATEDESTRSEPGEKEMVEI